MSQSVLSSVIRDGIIVAAKISAPILITMLAVGLLVSIIQSTMQLQEQTLTFVAKVSAAAILGMLCGSWMLKTIITYTENIFNLVIKITT